jgi:hypothetical protein
VAFTLKQPSAIVDSSAFIEFSTLFTNGDYSFGTPVDSACDRHGIRAPKGTFSQKRSSRPNLHRKPIPEDDNLGNIILTEGKKGFPSG